MKYEITIHPDAARLLDKEPPFELFLCRGLVCALLRHPSMGNWNGYVGVPPAHPLYGKDYSDKVVLNSLDEVKFNGNYISLFCADSGDASLNILPLDLSIEVHGGLTYAKGRLYGIDERITGKQWWFGFDTLHSGDANMYQFSYLKGLSLGGQEYRDFLYVRSQVTKLADQLRAFQPTPLIDVTLFLDRLEELRHRISI